MAPLFKPQQQVAGYEILELVGKGGMGEVYRARQVSMDRVVALKILAPKLVGKDPSFAARFIEEARAAGRLNHPNIIAVHDVGDTTVAGEDGAAEPVHYFSMEFVDGESVKDIIERQGALPPALTAQIMVAMAEALAYAESQHIVHRDIKPDNIMVAASGAVKLADLGLAQRVGDDEGEDGKRKVMGTPAYMSPEQARALAVGPQSDQYSLGATLFHMLTGRPPYAAPDAKALMKAHVFDPVPDPKAVLETVPEPWRQLCMRLMAKEPSARFASAVELRAAAKLASGVDGGAGVSRRHRTGPRPAGRRSGFGIVIAAVLLAAAGGGALLVLRRPAAVVPPPPRPPTERTPLADPAVDRARTFVAALPKDPAAAVAALDAALADGSHGAAARGILADARADCARRLKEREQAALAAEAAQKAFLARIAAIDEHIQRGRLGEAAGAFGGLVAADAEAAQTVRGCRERLDAAIAAFAAQLITRVEAAGDDKALRSVAADAEAAPLTAEQKREVEAACLGRKEALAKVAASEARRAEVGPRWSALAAALEPLRYSARYDDLRAAITNAIEGFPTVEAQEQARALLAVPELAQRAETFLRNHVRQKTPPAVVRINREPRKVQIVSLDDQQVMVRQTPGGTTRLDRAVVPLNYREFLAAAIDALPADLRKDKERLLAAFLFVWSPSEALAWSRQTPGDPLARAVLALEARRKASPLTARALRGADGRLSIAYDFVPGDTTLFADFVGDGIAAGERGLVWRTDKAMVPGEATEAALPTARWKGQLKAPMTVDAVLRLNRDASVVLIGVEAAGMRQRLGFAFRSSPSTVKVASLATTGKGKFSPGRNPIALALDLSQPVRVELQVDERRQVALAVNGQSIDKGYTLPDAPISVVMQAYQFEGSSSFEIESLLLEGAPAD